MKQFFVAFSLATLSMLASAQTTPTVAQSDPRVTARAKISAERVKLEAGFLAEDAACYKKFFVNSCLAGVNSRRREAMADLRRQEILLNDEERKIRGADQIRKTEEKSSLENQQQEADRRAKALQDYQSKMDEEQKKRDEGATARSREKSSSNANTERLKGQQEKIRAQTAKQAAAAEEARKFNERQSQAQERRVQHEADQLKQAKPPAKSLPLPLPE